MKLPWLVVIAFLLICVARGSSQAGERLPEDILKKKWVSLKLGFYFDGGDYFSRGPFVLIERLPDKRILLSYASRSNSGEPTPKPACHISEDEFAQIVSEVGTLWKKAQTDLSEQERIAKLPPEKQTEISKRRLFGLTEGRMKIEFKASDPDERCVFEKTIETCIADWIQLLRKTARVSSD